MRVQSVVILVAALGAVEAQASSIQTLQSTAATPSIVTLGEEIAIDPSIVAAVSEAGPTPSIITVRDTPDTPSIVALGEPAPAGEAVATVPPALSQRTARPMVIRGGEVGEAVARPSPAPAQAATEPLLDPNDRGTPAKRKALKRQEEQLARQAAEAAQNQQPDPSTEPAPRGR
jgi:hypothetical protein